MNSNTNQNVLDAIEAAAEREGAAIAWLEENVGDGHTHRVPLWAKKLSNEHKRYCRYPMAAALRCHQKIQFYFEKRLRGEPANFPRFRPFTDMCTKLDRARRSVHRQQRKLIIQAIERRLEQHITFIEAAAITATSVRALHRAMMRGQLHTITSGGQLLVDRSSLRDYIAHVRQFRGVAA